MEYIVTFLPTQDTNGGTDMTAHNTTTSVFQAAVLT